jgi:hypothetical protein
MSFRQAIAAAIFARPESTWIFRDIQRRCPEWSLVIQGSKSISFVESSPRQAPVKAVLAKDYEERRK